MLLRKVRSYVYRDGRMTEAQRSALDKNWPLFGLTLEQGEINLATVFQRTAPCLLEIGFGTGQSLLALAKNHPEINFIGVEAYLPGISALLLGIERARLTNIRIYHADAVNVLTSSIPEASLDGIQIFFPDPWPKRRHHKRRLIQTDFLTLLASRLKENGTLHLATDWQDYANHMANVLTIHPLFINLVENQLYSERSAKRPILTKFEQRGLTQGHLIRELQFARAAKYR